MNLPQRFLILFILLASVAHAEVISWNGDLRLRTQLEKNGDSQSRLREGQRARFGLKADLSPELAAEIRLMTGNDHRSGNSNLGDGSEPGGRRRSMGLDLAFAKWQAFPFLEMYVGRSPQIHFRPGNSQIILDEDISLEGISAHAKYIFAENFGVHLTAGSDHIRENYDSYFSQDLTDNMLNWAQARVVYETEWITATGGFGFFNFVKVQGQNFADLAVGGESFGNSVDGPGIVKSPYLPKQYFLEVRMRQNDLTYGCFGEFVVNKETSDPNEAIWAGILIEKRNLDFHLAYAAIESDAVLALFTHSNYGNGQTDTRGPVASLGWKFAKNMGLKLTHFDNRLDMTGANTAYWRSHLDITAQF